MDSFLVFGLTGESEKWARFLFIYFSIHNQCGFSYSFFLEGKHLLSLRQRRTVYLSSATNVNTCRFLYFPETQILIHQNGDVNSEPATARGFQFRKLQEVRAFQWMKIRTE